MKLAFALLSIPVAMSWTAGAVHAQQAYPSKPIRVLVGSPPGSGSDVIARAITQKLSERLGQQCVADNRPGAAGGVALEMLANAPADGYTIGTLSGQNVSGMVMKTISVDIPKALTPITLMISQPYVLVVTPALPVTSVKELIAYAKTKPLAYASSGIGSTVHLGMEMLKMMAGIDMTHVPYKGSGLSMVDLMGGRVQAAITNMLTAAPLVRSGRIRALAVTTSKRSPAMPDLPTVAEAGVPGYEVRSWYGLVAPKGAPAAVVSTLNRAVGAVMAAPEVHERLVADGAEVAEANSPEQFRALIASEIARWTSFRSRAKVNLD
ncbi:MAG TPA: tripartite tricarboxylate transporter substrate binding protein [Burkholderiales bacterium]|nr:tripartite tricarboxylate transporter substrate binding protein [Burkholderiales bacterium]